MMKADVDSASGMTLKNKAISGRQAAVSEQS
jgi:hypothetical protein